jgi:hypothetical protein
VASERAASSRRHAARRELFEQILTAAKTAGVKAHANRSPSDGPYVGAPAVPGRGWSNLVYGLAKTDTAVILEIDLGAGRDEDNRRVMSWLIANQRQAVDDAFGPGIDWHVEVAGRTAKARAWVGAGGWDDADRWTHETVPETVDAMRRLELGAAAAIKSANLEEILGEHATEAPPD